jgi:hypothetical protein
MDNTRRPRDQDAPPETSQAQPSENERRNSGSANPDILQITQNFTKHVLELVRGQAGENSAALKDIKESVADLQGQMQEAFLIFMNKSPTLL